MTRAQEIPFVHVPLERMPAWANPGRVLHGLPAPTRSGLLICPPCEVWWAPQPTTCWICDGPGTRLVDWFDEQRERQRARQRGAAA